MTEIEVAEIIIKQDGSCNEPVSIDCSECPAKRIRNEKGLDSCEYLWDFDVDKCKKWFENWLSEVM